MKQTLTKTLLATLLITTSVLVQAGSYEVTSQDVSGQVLLARWAASEGKLIRWYASDYFDLSKKDAEQLNLKLASATTLSEATGVLINTSSQKRIEHNKLPFKACVFAKGDIAVVVFDKDRTGGC